jgi:hypothetical protein
MKNKVIHLDSHPKLLFIKNIFLNAFKKKLLQNSLLLDFRENHLKTLKKYFKFNKSIQLIDKKFDVHNNSNDNYMI